MEWPIQTGKESWQNRAMTRQQKITFGEMRASGVSRVIVHCGDYKCGHTVTMYPALCAAVRTGRAFLARSAVTAAPMSGRCLGRRTWAQTPSFAFADRSPRIIFLESDQGSWSFG